MLLLNLLVLLLFVLYSLVQLLTNTLQGKLFKIYSSHKLLRIGVEAHMGQMMCGLAFLYVLVPAVLAQLGLGENEAHESDRPAFLCSGVHR